MKPIKKRLLKRLLSNPFIRGTIKSLPVGNLIYEIVDNIKHYKDPDKAKNPAPHSAISLAAQIVFLCLIIYAFATHQLTIDQVLNYVGIDDFKNFGQLPTDSIPN